MKDLGLLLLLLSLLLEQLDQPGHLPLVVLDLGLGVVKGYLRTSSLDGQCDPYVSFKLRMKRRSLLARTDFYSALLRGWRVSVTSLPCAGVNLMIKGGVAHG